jgi:hypothetical protein
MPKGKVKNAIGIERIKEALFLMYLEACNDSDTMIELANAHTIYEIAAMMKTKAAPGLHCSVCLEYLKCYVTSPPPGLA